jgi:hypothetical protein
MALPSSGNSISLNQVNIELGLSGTAQISLNDAAVRSLFGVASGQISMSDGYGKSAVTAPTWTNGAPSGGDEYICEWDEWGTGAGVSGTLPMTVELIMYASSCGSPYAISSVSTGGTGLVSDYSVSATNSSATAGGTYTGGATKYKAAHYRLKVSNSAGEIYSGVYHVNYGGCSTNQSCPGGESCTEACCQVDCSGDCNSAYQCRAECDQSDFDNCDQNGCACYPSACGYDCTCPGGYEYTTTYDGTNYAPQGTCTF